MKKVLITGPEFHDYNLSIERAFIKLGFETKVLGYYGGRVSSGTERVAYHLSRDKEGFMEKLRKRFNENLLGLYNSFQPDLVFIVQGSDVYTETIEKMRNAKKVLWMMDSIFGNKGGYGMRHAVDQIFLFEKTDVPRLMEKDKLKGWFLPLAVDEQVYFPTPRNESIDILFVGALYAGRIEMLQKVSEKFKDSVIQVYGHLYSPMRKPMYHFFRKNKHVFTNKIISPSAVNLLYSQSKICLNAHHEQSKHGVNQRFFEISGSKSFQLVDNNPYILEAFSSDEIMTYGSREELFDKIERMLKDDKTRNSMASNAHKKVMTHHTFTHRIKFVLDVVTGVSREWVANRDSNISSNADFS